MTLIAPLIVPNRRLDRVSGVSPYAVDPLMNFGTASDVSIVHEPVIEPLMVEMCFLFVSFEVRIASTVEDL